MEILMGMSGVLLGVVLFCLGWYARGKVSKQAVAEAEAASEAELKKMRADQEAFQQMLEYNMDMAYGGGGDELK